MLAKRKNSWNSKVYVKIVLVTLISVFVLFDEPVLAQRNKRRNKQSNNTSSQKQQRSVRSSSPRRQSSANIRSQSSRNRVSSAPRSTSRQNRSGSANILRRSKRQPTSRPSIRQPVNTTTKRQPNRTNTTNVTPQRTNPRSRVRNHSSNYVGTTEPMRVNSSQGKSTAKSVGTNNDTGRTLQIGSVVGNRKEPAFVARDNSTGSRRPARRARSSIGNVISNRREPASAARDNSTAGLSRPTTRTRLSIGNVISKRKEPTSAAGGQSASSPSRPTARARSSFGSILGRKRKNNSVDSGQSSEGQSRRAGTSRGARISSRILGRKSPAAESQASSESRFAGVGKSEAVANSTLSERKSTASSGTPPRGILGRFGRSKKRQNNSEVLDQSEAVSMWSDRNRRSRGRLDSESGIIRPRRGNSGIQSRAAGHGQRDSGREIRADGVRQQHFGRRRPPRPRYHDRPHLVRHEKNNVYVYKDRHARLCYRAVRPTTRFIVSYNHGWDCSFGFFYPYYHRKYVFVSLGGYWPWHYSCVRYHWYGWHPHYWSGYYPIAHEVEGDTYNYYTYNYYNDEGAAASYSQEPDYIPPVDHNTFADVREKLAREQAEVPDEPTLADNYFESAVKSFEVGNYNVAAQWFAGAIELAPNDMILPYAYCQALLANQQYSEATEVLRAALKKVNPEEEGVFYPRGLYTDDEVLFEQIKQLNEKTELLVFDSDLKLLLGYQLLGIGELDKAVEPLLFASQDEVNADAAVTLIKLLEKIRDSEAEVGDNEVGNVPPADGVVGRDSEIKQRESTFMATIFALATGGGVFYYARS